MHFSISSLSSDFSRPWSWASEWCIASPSGASTLWRIAERSTPRAFQCSMASRILSLSARPIISSKLLKPILAMYSRTSSATKKK